MRRKKPLLAAFLALVMLLMLLAACAPNETDTPPPPATPAPTPVPPPPTPSVPEEPDSRVWEEGPWSDLLPEQWNGLPKLTNEFVFRHSDPSEQRELVGNMYTTGYPIVQDTTTLSVMVRAADQIENFETNQLTLLLEEKTNVHINWWTVPPADAEAQRNLALASGNAPDIFMGMGFTQSDMVMYGDIQGVLLDVAPLLSTLAPNILAEFAHRPDAFGASTTPSGAIYGLPSTFVNIHVQAPAKGFVHREWLEDTGLPLPNTPDEFFEVFSAIRDNNPGVIPFVGSPTGWVTNLLGYLISPFILFDYTNPSYPYMIVDNGRVSSVLTTPEMRQGLEWMNMLYDEGIIEADSFIRDRAEMRALGDNPDGTLVGGASSAWAGGFTTIAERQALYTALPPLISNTGKGATIFDPEQLSVGVFVISADTEFPEIALRWGDMWYSPEITRISQFGFLGDEWDYAEPDELGLAGTQAVFRRNYQIMEEYTTQNIRLWGIDTPFAYGAQDLFLLLYNPGGPDAYDAFMTRYTQEMYLPHVRSEHFPMRMFVTEDDQREHARIFAERRMYVDEQTVRFIREGVTDSSWQTWLDTLASIGESQIVEMAQRSYNIYMR